MRSVNMMRLGIGLWFACYAFWALVGYLFNLQSGERLPILWTIINTTVLTAFLLVFIGMWLDTDKSEGDGR